MPDDTTQLLLRARDGDAAAGESLLPRIYEELRARAAGYLRHERAGHTLSPTALVHEAYLRLADGPGVDARGRTHFAALAAVAMRRVLIDHGRGRRAAKRRPAEGVVRLNTSLALSPPAASEPVDALALHEALERLAALHARQARLLELRFFGGLTMDEAAEVLGVSLATVESDWRMARTWLLRELSR